MNDKSIIAKINREEMLVTAAKKAAGRNKSPGGKKARKADRDAITDYLARHPTPASRF